MEKRILTALALSFLVIVIFQKMFPQPVATKPQQATQVTQNKSVINTTQDAVVNQVVSEPEWKETDKEIQTDKLILVFSNKGGVLKEVLMKDYQNQALVKTDRAEDSIFAITGSNISRNLDTVKYDIKESRNTLTFTYDDPASQTRVIKTYSYYPDQDFIDAIIRIENISGTSQAVNYDIVGPAGIQAATKLSDKRFIEANADLDGKFMRKTNIKNLKETFKGIVSWVALKNKYFTVAVKPPKDVDAFFIQKVGDKLLLGTTTKPVILNAGSALEDHYRLYMGPITSTRLKGAEMGIENIENYGIFGFISSFLLSVLRFVNSGVRNWGISIIIVTILINIVLFPLTKKSFLSMQKMQEIQPHMEKLRELHKDNPQKLNKEVMELYRTYNVNPLGGCFQMFLQLPIFIAFYQALMHSIELKNAGFLWIKDLSMPDAIWKFPAPLPFLGDNLNLLPILTLILMVVQQKVATGKASNSNDEMAKQQRMMTTIFPLFFGVILYNFPSGLVLYWLTNSILMTTEQAMLKKVHGKNLAV